MKISIKFRKLFCFDSLLFFEKNNDCISDWYSWITVNCNKKEFSKNFENDEWNYYDIKGLYL